MPTNRFLTKAMGSQAKSVEDQGANSNRAKNCFRVVFEKAIETFYHSDKLLQQRTEVFSSHPDDSCRRCSELCDLLGLLNLENPDGVQKSGPSAAFQQSIPTILTSDIERAAPQSSKTCPQSCPHHFAVRSFPSWLI